MKHKLVNWRLIVIVLGLLALIILIRDFNSRMAELRRLSSEKSIVSAQVTSLMATQNTLQTQVAYSQSDEAVQKWAYEEGRMVRPGENLIILMPAEGEDSESNQEADLLLEPIQNWELWLSLFVDNLPGRDASSNSSLP